MKKSTLSRLSLFAFPLLFGTAIGCGPDKDDNADDAEDAVEEAGEGVEETVEEAGDEIDDATE